MIECLLLPNILNGGISYSPDMDATYSCDIGYFLDVSQGSRVRTCMYNYDPIDSMGVWSGQEPRCVSTSLKYKCYKVD